jgi:hypothetical protein
MLGGKHHLRPALPKEAEHHQVSPGTVLVVFLDQFENIVSPVAAPGAVDAMREFLRELWEQKDLVSWSE